MISGRVGSSNAHTHNVTGTGPSVQHLPPYLDLVWIIKATPGGDPLADGTYIEVRDEGIPDVPTATALDFRGAGVNVDPSGPVAIVTIGAQAGVTDHGALTGLGRRRSPAVPDERARRSAVCRRRARARCAV